MASLQDLAQLVAGMSGPMPNTLSALSAKVAPQMDSQRRPLSPGMEAQFQSDMQTNPAYAGWQNSFQQRFGESPNLNDPEYDYRTAWRYGEKPQTYGPDGGFPHWGSSVDAAPYAQPLPLKQGGHPTEWMNDYMNQTGVDPNTMSPQQMGAMGTVYGVKPRTPAMPGSLLDLMMGQR